MFRLRDIACNCEPGKGCPIAQAIPKPCLPGPDRYGRDTGQDGNGCEQRTPEASRPVGHHRHEAEFDDFSFSALFSEQHFSCLKVAIAEVGEQRQQANWGPNPRNFFNSKYDCGTNGCYSGQKPQRA